MTRFTKLLLVHGVCAWLGAQVMASGPGLLSRRYQDGETLTYRMTGENSGWRFEIRAEGVARIDSGGGYIEEYGWSDLKSNGSPIALPAASLEFRQVLSLTPGKAPAIPKLAGIHPMLIGPITDFLTFYADLWLANRLGKLVAAGDHIYHEHGAPVSWADGRRVVLGESSIDFDFTLAEVSLSGQIATLVVRHVPPKQPQVRLPADWMGKPVADTPNNWVSVVREKGKYVAAVGKETFDVTMKVSLVDGKMLSGMMENTVRASQRDCVDEAFMNCGDARPREIYRQINVSLED